MKTYRISFCILLPVALLAGCNTLAVPGNGNGMPVQGSLNASAGAHLFGSPQMTNFGVAVSCQSCHGEAGSGGRAPAIRGYSAEVLARHARGEATHPAPTGRRPAKFPELGDGDFEAIATFLRAEAHSDAGVPIAGS